MYKKSTWNNSGPLKQWLQTNSHDIRYCKAFLAAKKFYNDLDRIACGTAPNIAREYFGYTAQSFFESHHDDIEDALWFGHRITAFATLGNHKKGMSLDGGVDLEITVYNPEGSIEKKERIPAHITVSFAPIGHIFAIGSQFTQLNRKGKAVQ